MDKPSCLKASAISRKFILRSDGMNDQERLETIRQTKYTVVGDETTKNLFKKDREWLIQQTEEKQELERHIEVTDWELAGEKAQNKRYEETLEQLKTFFLAHKQYPGWSPDINKLVEHIDNTLQKKEGNKMSKTINQLCQEAYETAKSKGWHDEERETGTLLALVHSEVSEALEADRKGNQEEFEIELADVCIRIFDLCGARNIDLEGAINFKMALNKGRSYKHGNKAY
jgi:NTP pyrophosphatase (non-canonical NTP hydrolase)